MLLLCPDHKMCINKSCDEKVVLPIKNNIQCVLK